MKQTHHWTGDIKYSENSMCATLLHVSSFCLFVFLVVYERHLHFFPLFFHVFTAASVLLLGGYISAQPHTDNMAEMILMFFTRNIAKIISQILAASRKNHWMLHVGNYVKMG